MLNWEDIQHDNVFVLRRTKIFGGWLVSAISDVMTPQNTMEGFINNSFGYQWRTSITFVPDPNHEWKLEQ